MAKKKSTIQPVFRRHVNIGAADAESDQFFLENCFVDTGDIEVLKDCKDPRRIVVGRTGSGKTALLQKLVETTEHSAELAPEVLALNHISNSDILSFFEELGVQLYGFYILLWRHVITTELLKQKYDIHDEESQNDFLTRLYNLIPKNAAKQAAIEYVRNWGDKFWEETETRVRELTTQIEKELAGTVGATDGVFQFGVEGAKKLSETQKSDIVERANRVVNQVQIRRLTDLIDLLADDIFDDPQERFYLIIDRLDEDWAEEKIRYDLIKALIEAVRGFQKVQNVKIVLALRTDLLQRVLEYTRTSAFQEEKYEALFLKIRWNRDDITSLLNKRISFLFRDQYTNNKIDVRDILPKNQIDQKDSLNYLLDRTFLRPREAILFLNECIERSESRATISLNILKQAELSYSQKRLRSLENEWHADFPLLGGYVAPLRKKRRSFKVADLGDNEFEVLCEKLFQNNAGVNDPLKRSVDHCTNGQCEVADIYSEWLCILYRIGVIGIKPESYQTTLWSYEDEPTVPPEMFQQDTTLQIHPTFWGVLGVNSQ